MLSRRRLAPGMTVLVVGGAGFVGLTIAQALLAAGRDVTILDMSRIPDRAGRDLAGLPGRLTTHVGDVRDPAAVAAALTTGTDAVIMGAAITAGPEREALEPERILEVNLVAQVALLRRAAEIGVRRVVNLSSAAAYGRAGFETALLDERTPGSPEGLYAITKLASEQVAARLSGLWGVPVVSLRLSAVFGPWERATGMRDTLSPQAQMMALADEGRPAILSRPGLRDWIYGPDVAAAVSAILDAPALAHPVYNVTTPYVTSALDWGRRLAALRPGFACRLAEPGEAATVDLHAARDRAPLGGDRLAAELGWRAAYDLERSVGHWARWHDERRLGAAA